MAVQVELVVAVLENVQLLYRGLLVEVYIMGDVRMGLVQDWCKVEQRVELKMEIVVGRVLG